MLVWVVRKDIASKPLRHYRLWWCYSVVSVLMRLDLGWPPAPHLPYSLCVAPAILHCRHANTPLKSVRIVRKDIASKLLCLYRWWRCYSVVSVLMSVDLRWPPAPDLPYSLCVAPAILHCRHKNTPLKSVRIVRKDIASKPWSKSCWSSCYKLVCFLMMLKLECPPAPHLPSSSCVAAAI